MLELGGSAEIFGGYMKMQWISGGPKRAAAAMLLALGLGGLAVAGAEHLLNPPATFKFASPEAPASRNSFAPVVKKVLPSVVTITSSRVTKTGFSGGDDGIPPMFRQFFGIDPGDGGGSSACLGNRKKEGLAWCDRQPEWLHPDQQPRGGPCHHGDGDHARQARV
jgi:S1-C subfamily serine protease